MEQGGKDGAGAAPLPRVVFLTSPALLASSCPGSPRVFVSLAGPAPLTAVVGFGKVAPPRPNPVWLPGGAGREGGRTASAARGSFTGGRRSAGGRRRALLLRYYSVKTKHILRPSSAALARKCIFQSGWSQAFI